MNSKSFALKIRELSLKMVTSANASHIGSALSIADIVAVLYAETMNLDPKKINYEDRDRFILSKGHACVAIYAALAIKGFFNEKELDSYGKNFSILMNHISHKVPGVEFSTGALGHGLSFGVGKALSLKLSGNKSKIYVLMSDGEMQEGSNWEALMFAAHNELDNLVALIDYNNLQSLDTVDNTLSLQPLMQKVESFGADVCVIDGHDHSALKRALNKKSQVKPKVIICNTIKGKGVSFMENQVSWHYSSPTFEELSDALAELTDEK